MVAEVSLSTTLGEFLNDVFKGQFSTDSLNTTASDDEAVRVELGSNSFPATIANRTIRLSPRVIADLIKPNFSDFSQIQTAYRGAQATSAYRAQINVNLTFQNNFELNYDKISLTFSPTFVIQQNNVTYGPDVKPVPKPVVPKPQSVPDPPGDETPVPQPVPEPPEEEIPMPDPQPPVDETPTPEPEPIPESPVEESPPAPEPEPPADETPEPTPQPDPRPKPPKQDKDKNHGKGHEKHDHHVQDRRIDLDEIKNLVERIKQFENKKVSFRK